MEREVFVSTTHTQIFSGGRAISETLILPLTPANRLPHKDLRWVYEHHFLNSLCLLTGDLDPPRKRLLKVACSKGLKWVGF
jgi:hypothetical protein